MTGGLKPRSVEEDSVLAVRFRDGDAEALGELYLRYFPSVFQTVGPRAGDPAIAEDLAQGTFLRAWEQRERLRDPEKFPAWLLATARHLALDERRRRLRHTTEEAGEDVPSGEPAPDEAVVAAETPELVRSAMSSLTPRHREVLHLAIREQLSTREVGMVLGVSTAHAAVLVHRAKRAFEVAVRTLLVATRARECPRLQRLIPANLVALSPGEGSTVDRHMRRCQDCRAAADRLTAPSQLFEALPLLALPQGWDSSGLQSTVGHLGSGAVGKAAGTAGHALRATVAALAAGGVAVTALVVSHSAPPRPAPAPPPAVSPSASLIGRIIISGDDPDVHAHSGPNSPGAQHVIQASVRFVTRARAGPRLLLVTDVRDPGGALHGDPRLGLRDAGYTPEVADYGSGAPGILDLRTVRFTNYDAVIIASDFGGWLRQDELDILDARRSDLSAYTAAGGGVIAFAEGGAAATSGSLPLTTHGYFGFLPLAWNVAPLSEYQSGVTVTSAGLGIGLSPDDEARNFLHAAFTPPAGATVLVTDAAGRAIAFSMPAAPPNPRAG